MAINILDVFNSDAFGVVSLTAAINDISPQYGRLGALGLFSEEGVSNKTVAVDFDPITNSLLPQSKWGGPGVANKSALGKTKSFAVPHFPVIDEILAADLQGRRRPGSDAVQDAQYVLGKKMREMRAKLEQTREWMRLGVLKAGLVKDGAGSTILDIYTDFGVAQAVTSFELDVAATDVLGLIAARKRAILAALRGELMTGFVALCSDDFYDLLVAHANVKDAFKYYQNNGQTLADDFSGGAVQPNAAGLFAGVGRPFYFGGVAWVNYSGSTTDSAGAAAPMIDAGSAYMFPLGTGVFKEFLAPADYIETVNTEGLPFYAKQRLMEFEKGIQVECQSNPLPICLKPLVVQKLTKT